MKINISNNCKPESSVKNNKHKGKLEEIELVRPWAEIIKMEGVQAGNNLNARATIKNIAFQTISPVKINITGNIDVTTEKYNQKSSTQPIKLKWDKTLRTIPEKHKSISLNTLLKIPENKPKIKQLKTIKPELKYINAKTLPNRIAIKGEVIFKIWYYHKD